MIKTIRSFVKNTFRKNGMKSRYLKLENYENAKFRITCEIERYRIENYGGEKEALDYFLDLSKGSNVIYDIGASVGLYSIIAAKINSQVIVYSFEPDPETITRLNENIAINKLTNIETFDKACSDKEGDVKLFSDGVNGFAPSLAEQSKRKGAPKKSIKIKCDTIDNIISINHLRLPDLIKVDIEGAEILFLRGAKNLLDGNLGKKPKDIFIELHPVFLSDFNSDLEEIFSLFLNHGYKNIWESRREEQIHCHYQLIN